MKHMTLNFAKLDKFEGVDFRRWQNKMHFLISSMSVVCVLTTSILEDGENATVDQISRRNKWENDDYVYRGLILNEDASSKKFLVSCIIEKLPPFLKDFKHTLKHNKEELTLVELGSHMRIEESLRAQDNDKPKGNNVIGPTESRVLGVVVRVPNLKLKTLGEKDTECIFVGYAEHSKAFRLSSAPRPSQSLEKGKRNRTPKNFRPEFQLYLIEEIIDEVSNQHSYYFNVEDDLKTFDESMKSQDVAFWKETNNDEMDSIMDNNTWVLVDLPLGCKWIFKRKLKVNGTIDKFKARLVIQGFKQKSGIYYFDTYAPVTRISTIRLLIVMASIHNLIIHQMDANTTFLNGEVDEEFDLTKEFLSSRFSLKDMRKADVILGIRIKYESNGIAISQSHYIEKVLKKFNYFDCTLVSTPMDTSEKLMPNNVGKLSRYTSNPGYHSVIKGYTDASWISNTKDNSSISGWVFLLGGGAIAWAFKKQTCITSSTMEYEFMALAAAGKESEWLNPALVF
ncbi:zinc finger, CCHC-type containing protein [Tanacetum coccineum]